MWNAFLVEVITLYSKVLSPLIKRKESKGDGLAPRLFEAKVSFL